MDCRHTLAFIAAALLAGCASQPASYSWSHPASGEYLFAFDKRECDAHARTEALSMETELNAFMACMTDRGYYLVDPATGEPLIAEADTRRPAAVGIEARN